jgi:hypothetical protein
MEQIMELNPNSKKISLGFKENKGFFFTLNQES